MSDVYKVTTLPQLNIGKKKSGGVGGGKNGLTGKLVGITDEDLQLSDGSTGIIFEFYRRWIIKLEFVINIARDEIE